jgi:hypothetical protein
MKGLLIKDIKLMLNQKKFFITIGFIALMLVSVVKDTSFIISYITFIGALFTLSTINYDEYDNGNAFLFSLPVTRSGYVAEKYGFGLMMGGSCWLFSLLIAIVSGEVRKTAAAWDILLTAIEIFPVILILLAMMIPFQLKFGGEKGRIAAIAVVGAVFVVCILVGKAADIMEIDLIDLLNRMPKLGWGAIVGLTMAAAAALLLLSASISVAIMKKKEF